MILHDSGFIFIMLIEINLDCVVLRNIFITIRDIPGKPIRLFLDVLSGLVNYILLLFNRIDISNIQDISDKGISMYDDSSIEDIPIILRYTNSRNVLELRF